MEVVKQQVQDTLELALCRLLVEAVAAAAGKGLVGVPEACASTEVDHCRFSSCQVEQIYHVGEIEGERLFFEEGA